MWAGFRQRLALFFRGNKRPAVAVFTCKAQRQPFDIAAGVAFLLAPNVSMYRLLARLTQANTKATVPAPTQGLLPTAVR